MSLLTFILYSIHLIEASFVIAMLGLLIHCRVWQEVGNMWVPVGLRVRKYKAQSHSTFKTDICTDGVFCLSFVFVTCGILTIL